MSPKGTLHYESEGWTLGKRHRAPRKGRGWKGISKMFDDPLIEAHLLESSGN